MEIKPQELRIGNWYIDARINRSFVVKEIRSNCIEHGDDDYSPTFVKDMKGIDLTPEWLEKFGFEYAEGFADDYTRKPITLYCNPFKTGWVVENLFNQQIKDDLLVVQYVHQLQNLYFALTGKELAIDSKSL